MRAIVIASAPLPEWPELGGRHGACMLPLGDRPFLQHVIERLVQAGIARVDVVLAEHPLEAEALLGDGTRWGVRIRHHLVRNPDEVFDRCRLLAEGAGEEAILLVRGDRILLTDPLPAAEDAAGGAVAFCAPNDDEDASDMGWTGWAWLPAPLLARMPAKRGRRASEDWLLAEALVSGRTQRSARALKARPLQALLDAQRRLLSGEVAELLIDGREIRPGVRVARAAAIDPEAILEPPVHVGERARIGRGARIGPNVVIGARSFVGPETTLTEALVLADSFVGEALALRGVIVDRSLIAHLEGSAELPVDESSLLAGLSRLDPLRPPRLGSRIVALLGLALGWPILLGTSTLLRLRGGSGALRRRSVISLPASADSTGWRVVELRSFVASEPSPSEGLSGPKDLFLRVLPGLLNVARGELSLVGIRARTAEELRALPPHWLRLCLGAQAGLISEAYLEHGPRPSEEEAFASECLQVASAGLGRRTLRLLRYAWRLLRPAGV